jgi:hypothetical protein
VRNLRLVVAALLVSFVGPVVAQVTTHYVRPKNPKLMSTAVMVRDGRMLEALATATTQNIRVPEHLSLVMAECGQPNAFYQRDKKAIILCYEFFDDIVSGLLRDFGKRVPRATLTNMAGGLLAFVYLHELGHALVNLLNLPVLGREEDAADQIATYLLLQSTNFQQLTDGFVAVHWFNRKKTFFYTRRHYADEHSLGPQRQFNIACWAYGSNPQQFLALAQYAKLPRERAVRCGNEYQQLHNAVGQLLSGHLLTAAAAARSSKPSPRAIDTVKLLEEALRCSTKPNPRLVLGPLQFAGAVSQQTYLNVDSVSYFSASGLKAFGLPVAAVFGFDHNPSMFARGPGTSPPITIGAIFEATPADVESALRRAGVNNVSAKSVDDLDEHSRALKTAMQLTALTCVE